MKLEIFEILNSRDIDRASRSMAKSASTSRLTYPAGLRPRLLALAVNAVIFCLPSPVTSSLAVVDVDDMGRSSFIIACDPKPYARCAIGATFSPKGPW